MADDKGQTASDRQRMSIATDEAAMSQNSKIATGVGAAAGGIAGGVAGGSAAAAGAAVGGVAGPVGAALGAVAGAVVGALAGQAVAKADPSVDPTIEEAYWREHHASRPYTAGAPYEHYAPAYRHGASVHARYPGREFDDVEPELGAAWASERGDSPLSWEQARAASRDAWQRRRPASLP